MKIVIDGQPLRVPGGLDHSGGLPAGGDQGAVLLLAPRPVGAGRVSPVSGRDQGIPQADSVLLHAGGRQDGGHHQLAQGAGRAAADAGIHPAQPPHRLPHLRQGGRVPVAEALLRLGRACRPQRWRQGAQGQGGRPRPAHRARPGTLHSVLALHPRVQRGGAPARIWSWPFAGIASF